MIATVYAVFADAAEAERIAETVVTEQLAACANLLARCRSIYCWQGAVERAEEVPALFKTAQPDALIARIAALHSYDVPAAVAWRIEEAYAPYAAWVQENS
ncbi:divalent cation tolerance protein CutA [Sphingomonas sp. MAH-20]|jgi:periplasmic divalent cation tolerance protein|uniref:Divalent cation tolerance protein CutA n=2 Tax=Sphingomonadaceae TaxID=41297 RepID=A0A6I4IYU9_9SPHN|nr:divalent-cation tolerance protein CutA [Sphingomonas horti]MBA2918463.1 divalent-cation tolerance protein CutA [Sphingomonas sp. CGMCC 1.13658]MVO77430.1 divalent cation tolerance protein CutA [Sphingomonas horti]